MLVTVVYTLMLIHYEAEKIENEAAREFKYPLYIIMVSGAAELALYYIRNFETTSIFLPLGTMGFIVSLIWIQVYRYYDQYVQKQKIAYLQKMANMDMLTAAMNRNAYENMIKYLDEQEIELPGACKKVLINNYPDVVIDGNKIKLHGYQVLVLELAA